MPDYDVDDALASARQRAARWAPVAGVANDGLIACLAVQRLCGHTLDAGEHRALGVVLRILFEAATAADGSA